MRIAFVVQARDARHLSEVGGRSTQVVALQAQRLLKRPHIFGAKKLEVQQKREKPIIIIHPPSVVQSGSVGSNLGYPPKFYRVRDAISGTNSTF